MTVYSGITCTYVADFTAKLTAAALATAMAAVPVVNSVAGLNTPIVPTITSGVNGNGFAFVSYTFAFSAEFLGDYPAGSDQRAPFFGFMTAALRSALSHPVLEQAVTLLLTPTLEVSVNPTTAPFGTGTDATATVTGTGPVPTGTVQFTIQGIGNVGAPQNLVAGVASFNIPGADFPNAGTTYEIGYTYSGDGNYTPGVSPNTPFVVEPS